MAFFARLDFFHLKASMYPHFEIMAAPPGFSNPHPEIRGFYQNVYIG